jgi:PST family polysaccharide transporter
MPLTAFLFVASKPVIELLLGRQWLGVAPIFSCLAFAAFVQPTYSLAGSLMLSLGQGRRYLQCGSFNAVILCASFIVGLPWGPVGVALSYAVANYISLYPWMAWAFRGSPVSFRDFVDACALPAVFSTISVALVSVIKPYISVLPPVGQISVAISIFIIVIACSLCLTSAGRRQVSFGIGLFTHFRGRNKCTIVPS